MPSTYCAIAVLKYPICLSYQWTAFINIRGMLGPEDGVALVLRVGTQQVEAHQVALPHRVGVGQQGFQ